MASSRWSGAVWVTIAPLLLLAAVGARPCPADASDGYSDEQLIEAALEVYNEFSDSPVPYLDARQLSKLAEHEVVRVRRSGRDTGDENDHHEEAVGYILIERPRPRVWVAALDPAFEGSDLLTEVRISRDEDGGSVWYQYADLPWPISDRHWVIRLAKNRGLTERTRDFVWEHTWTLAENGPALARQTLREGRAGELTLEKVQKAIYLPHNQGGWTMFALEEGRTLVLYRVSTDVGGSIPESWIATFAMAQLEGLLRRLEGHVAGAAESYDASLYPIRDGRGRTIETLVD